MLCVIEIVNIPRSKAFGTRGWGGCETGPFPSFSRGGRAINKKIPFLSGADGVVCNFKQNTEATRLFTNHPRPLRGLPSFERRGMNSLQQLSSISKLLASGELHPLISRLVVLIEGTTQISTCLLG